MKKLLTIMALAMVAIFAVGQVHAADYPSGNLTSFAVSASIPPATGVSVTAHKITAATNTGWTDPEVFSFDFNSGDRLEFDSELGIWYSNYFFAVDVGLVGGAGSISTNVKYTAVPPPTGQTKGLDWKATAKFVRMYKEANQSGELEDKEADLSYGKQLLNQLIGSGVTVSQTDIAGGWLRLYVGLVDGGDSAITALGGEPFTNADRPGTYTGTLTITATAS